MRLNVEAIEAFFEKKAEDGSIKIGVPENNDEALPAILMDYDTDEAVEVIRKTFEDNEEILKLCVENRLVSSESPPVTMFTVEDLDRAIDFLDEDVVSGVDLARD